MKDFNFHEVLKKSISDSESDFFVVDDVFVKYSFIDVSKPIVLSFSNAGFVTTKENIKDLNYSPWAYLYLKKKGVNVISFSSIEKGNWYRSDVFIRFLEEISCLLDVFPARFGYGSSMGGYAAGAFSKLLGFDRVLLLNPISTLNYELAPWDNIKREYASTLNWNSKYHDGADVFCDGIVVYDPLYSNDSKHAKRYKTLKHVVFPGVGHSLPYHLHLLGLVNLLVESTISGAFDRDLYYKKLRGRRFYYRYYSWLLSGQNKHLTEKRAKVIKRFQRKFREMSGAELSSSSSASYVDMLRDDALKIEKDNIHLAYSLMTRALELRPNGVLIKRKVAEYELKLNKKI